MIYIYYIYISIYKGLPSSKGSVSLICFLFKSGSHLYIPKLSDDKLSTKRKTTPTPTYNLRIVCGPACKTCHTTLSCHIAGVHELCLAKNALQHWLCLHIRYHETHKSHFHALSRSWGSTCPFSVMDVLRTMYRIILHKHMCRMYVGQYHFLDHRYLIDL